MYLNAKKNLTWWPRIRPWKWLGSTCFRNEMIIFLTNEMQKYSEKRNKSFLLHKHGLHRVHSLSEVWSFQLVSNYFFWYFKYHKYFSNPNGLFSSFVRLIWFWNFEHLKTKLTQTVTIPSKKLYDHGPPGPSLGTSATIFEGFALLPRW